MLTTFDAKLTHHYLPLGLAALWLHPLVALPTGSLVSEMLLVILGLTLVLASLFDVNEKRIPNKLVLVACLTALPLQRMLPLDENPSPILTHSIISSLIGALVLFSVTLAIWMLGGFGGGDVKLLTFIGLVIGAQLGLLVLLLAQLIAAAYLLLLRLRVSQSSCEGEVRPDTSLPMAPFFSLAVLLVSIGELAV